MVNSKYRINIEALSDHTIGTGTIVGDKAEALAFATTMGKDHTEQVIVGSVKSNLGHIENASGLASVIKTVLMMENGAIPPVLRQ